MLVRRHFVASFAVCASILASVAGATPVTAPLPPGVAGNGMGVAPFTTTADTNGNWFQQVYAASFFSPVGSDLLFTEVAFRPKQGALSTFIGSRVTVSNLQVRLSTTLRNADTDFPNGLNADLATNVGADVLTVYAGAATFITDRVFGDTDVEDFDFRLVFQTPFYYRPSLGNLLLDVIIPAGATVRSFTSTGAPATNFTQLDAFTDGFPSRDGVASATDANLLDGLSVGSNSTTGVVTQFQVTPVPEPGTFAFLGIGLTLAGAAALRARRR